MRKYCLTISKTKVTEVLGKNRSTVFVSYTNTWYDNKSQGEVLNLLLFSQLERALSTSGLAGLDTLFAFMVATELNVRTGMLHGFGNYMRITICFGELDPVQ